MVDSPLFALRLVKARSSYFGRRRFAEPIVTPDGFIIETEHELISYWSFFVERECWDRQWINALLTDSAPLVLDVGANAGLFTHMIWRLRPDTEIIVFEPLPRMAQKVVAWQRRTNARATIHSVAVSNFEGTADFFVASDHDTSASLGSVSAKHVPIKVPVVCLDSVVPEKAVCLMKIDVEGFEPQVLEGGKRTAANSRFIIAEAHTADALRRIRDKLGASWDWKQVGASDYLFRNRALN